MMGQNGGDQNRLFYSFNLDEHVHGSPAAEHRSISRSLRSAPASGTVLQPHRPSVGGPGADDPSPASALDCSMSGSRSHGGSWHPTSRTQRSAWCLPSAPPSLQPIQTEWFPHNSLASGNILGAAGGTKHFISGGFHPGEIRRRRSPSTR